MIREGYKLPPNHQAIVAEFVNHKIAAKNIREGTQKNYLTTFKTLSRFFPEKTLEYLEKEDLEKFFGTLRKEKRYKENTIKKMVAHLKTFFRYLEKGRDKDKRIPGSIEKMADFKVGEYQLGVQITDLLTEDEIRLLINAANKKYRCLLSILIEGGLRISEVLDLTVDCLVPAPYGFDINIPDTKMDGTKQHARTIIISDLAVHVAEHLSTRPRTAGTPLFKHHGYSGAYAYLKTLALSLGLEVWFHLLRHMAGTYWSAKLTDQTLKGYMGWKPTSKMPGRYSHLSPKKIKDEVRKAKGLTEEGDPQREYVEKIICNRCKHENTGTRFFCAICAYPLTEEAQQVLVKETLYREDTRKKVMELEEKNREYGEKIAELGKIVKMLQLLIPEYLKAPREADLH